MAVMMIMGLALLIYAFAERQLRLMLTENDEMVPDQKGKPTQTPTIRWVFQTFEGLMFYPFGSMTNESLARS